MGLPTDGLSRSLPALNKNISLWYFYDALYEACFEQFHEHVPLKFNRSHIHYTVGTGLFNEAGPTKNFQQFFLVTAIFDELSFHGPLDPPIKFIEIF